MENNKSVEVTIESLLEAGAHFGHKIERWNPKMLPFIYGKKGDIHVINLDLTLEYWKKAAPVIQKAAEDGSSFLFVGTKEQAREAVKQAAEDAEVFYVNYRWLGGALTNFETIRRSIARMNKLEELLIKAEDPESEVRLAKKEILQIKRKLEKLSANLAGVRKMKRIPDYMFVVDINRDSIAIQEAKRLHIPVIALVDTNTDPSLVDYPIPTNDDSKRAIELFTSAVAEQIKKGRKASRRNNAQAVEAKTEVAQEEPEMETAASPAA